MFKNHFKRTCAGTVSCLPLLFCGKPEAPGVTSARRCGVRASGGGPGPFGATGLRRPRLRRAGKWRGAFQEIRLQQGPLGRSELGACLGVQQADYAVPRR
jgi:hypothetical protein